MHFVYWIFVYVLCEKHFEVPCRCLGESEEGGSGVLQRSHLSKLSLNTPTMLFRLSKYQECKKYWLQSDKSWLLCSSYVNLEGKLHISVLILWIYLNLWQLHEWCGCGNALCTCLFLWSTKGKSSMRNIRMACLDKRHSLRILLPGHLFSSKKNIWFIKSRNLALC